MAEAIAESPPLHCSLKTTLFETIVYLFDWFSSHPSLSKEAFSKNLQLWHSILPEGNILPTSYQEAYKVIRPYLVPEIVFHVCINDCILYRGELKDSVVCAKCNEPRFRVQNIPKRTFLREHSIIYLLAQGLSEVMELKKFHVYCKVMEEKLVK